MPSRTDDPARTRPQIEARPASASPLTASPGSRPAQRGSGDPPLTHESFQALLSSHQRAGRWEVADEIEVRALFGAVVLDFTHAELPPSGVIEIDALAFCGSVEIIVPDGAEVELGGTPFLGSIEQKRRRKGAGERIREWVAGARDEDVPASSADLEPPYFHIDCQVIAGSVEVKGR